MLKIVATSIVTLITLLATVQPVLADTALSGEEIKQAISGNTVVGERWKKGVSKEYIQKAIRFKTYFNKNGQLAEKGDTTGQGYSSSILAHGSWKVKKNKLCFTFSDAIRKSGEQMCHKVIRRDDNTYGLTKKGKDKRVWKEILPGNPYNLE